MRRNRSFWLMLTTLCVVMTALLTSQPWHAQAEPLPNSVTSDTDDDLFADRGDAAEDAFESDDEFDPDEFDEDEGAGEGERKFEDEGEGEEEEWEWLEHEMDELEVRYLELETVSNIAKIADNEVGSAALALSHVEGLFEEDLSGLTTFLSDALSEAEHPGIQRLLRFKLAELHFDQDQPDQARTQLRHLITGK